MGSMDEIPTDLKYGTQSSATSSSQFCLSFMVMSPARSLSAPLWNSAVLPSVSGSSQTRPTPFAADAQSADSFPVPRSTTVISST